MVTIYEILITAFILNLIKIYLNIELILILIKILFIVFILNFKEICLKMYNVNNVYGGRKFNYRKHPICRYSTMETKSYRVPVLGNSKREIQALKINVDGYDNLITPGSESYDPNISYTTRVNDWCYANGLLFEKITQTQNGSGERRKWQYERTIFIMERIIKALGVGNSINQAKEMCNYSIYLDIIQPRAQMESDNSKESEQGLAIQASTKNSNTIITRDEGSQSTTTEQGTSIIDVVSSEPVSTFRECVNRWMPLQVLTVTTGDKIEEYITSYYLPETLFKQMCNSINLLPFEAYIYSELDVELKFVTNANKFHCGKILVSVKFDSYQADMLQNTLQAGLSRPHAIIDLSTNNEVTVKVPFRYHRALVRNVKNDSSSVGIRPSKYASVYVQVLSPLRTGLQGSTEMNIRPFVRFRKANFAGMSYRVKVQMDAVSNLMNAVPNKELRQVLGGAENLLKSIGSTPNRDKPTTLKSIIMIPRPKLNFGSGKGLMDVVPLKNNPYSMTSYNHVRPFNDDPKTMLDVAHIWGLRNTFIWQVGMKPTGKFLGSVVIDPTCRKYDAEYNGTLTPLEYVCAMYNFWSGPIEMRMDFVSNSFHTGAIMVSIEFGRPLEGEGESSKCDAASTYTKTFHLGEQKSFTFTIPYIYDTVWRRSACLPYNPLREGPKGTDDIKKRSLVVYPESKTVVNIQVINELRPVATAPQEIDVLLFWRGGPNFMVHGIKQSSLAHTNVLVGMDNFPFEYSPVEPVEHQQKKKRDTEAIDNHKQLPKDVRNEWNEYAENKIKVQMDTGEKEDQDPTMDFNKGRFNLDVQTNDSQVSIKDILRRPTLIVYRQTVEPLAKKNTGFFLPVMPPTEMMRYNSEFVGIFSGLVGTTPQAHINNMFRFWRGCTRYTIIVEECDGNKLVNGSNGVEINTPVYVTYVPHTGVRIFGNRKLYGDDVDRADLRPIFGCGLTTEIIMPKINPMVTIETPYDTENNWTLMIEEDGLRNYSWRDKGDTNCGHIVITSHKQCVITIWWSAGDDFEVANFYGPTKGYIKESEYSYPDKHARVQMDFQDEDNSYLRRIVSVGKHVMPAAIASIPIVGTPLATGIGVYRCNKIGTDVNNCVKEVTQTINNVGNNMNTLVDEATITLTTVKDSLVNVNTHMDSFTESIGAITNQLNAILGNLVQGIPSLEKIRHIVQDIILDVFISWYTKSWVAVGVGVVRIIGKFFNSMDLYGFATQISHAISALMGEPIVAQADNPQVTLVGVLAALMGTVMGVVLDTNNYMSKFQLLMTRFTTSQGISYINQVLLFVSKTFECIKQMVMDALGMVDPSVKSLQLLVSNSAIIQDFVMSSQACLNEANAHLFNDPRFRLKFWTTVLRAYQIQRAVVSVQLQNPGLPSLLKLTGDIIKKGNEKFVDLSCSPVRYEPFVICIVGQSNIGKSFASKELINQLLDHVGVRNEGETIYTRMPGSKFWNGYRGHQCVVYDDWLNITDPQIIAQQLNELYMLKSTCEFIPEMADLADKKIKANPLIVLQLCNDAFPTCVSNLANCKKAVFRRRDIVLEARIKREYEGMNPRDFREHGIGPGEQLEFTMWKSSSDETTKSGVYRNYQETLTYLKSVYKRYHQQEQLNVKQRVQALRVGFEEETQGELVDPFELFYATQLRYITTAQTGWLPSEQLEQAVLEIVDKVERIPEEVIVTLEQEPANIFQGPLDFITTAINTVILSPHFIVRATDWTWDKIQRYLDKVITQSSALYGKCCVCLQDEVQLTHACKEAGDLHAICLPCYTGIRTHSERTTCPMCRSENMEPILHGSTGAIYMAIRWILKMGRSYITPFLNFLKDKLARYFPMKLYYILKILANVLSFTTVGAGIAVGTGINLALEYASTNTTLLDEIQYQGIHYYYNTVPAMHIVGQAAEIIVPQLDDDWPDVEPIIEPEVVQDPLNNVQVNEHLLETYVNNINKRVAICLHQKLVESVHCAVFERRNYSDQNIYMWRIPITNNDQTVFTYVEDGPCCEECPFKLSNVVVHFYEEWIELNRTSLRNKYVAVHNNVVRREQVLESIPYLLRPEWMGNNPIILNKNWWEYLKEAYENHKRFIIMCGLVVAALGGLYKLTRFFNNTIPQSDMNYNSGEIRQLRRLNRAPRLHRQEISPQSEELQDVVSNYIAKNYILIKIWKNDKIIKQLAAVGLVGNTCIMPNHYLQVMSQSDTMTIEPALYQNGDSNHMRKSYVYNENDFVIMQNTDLVFFSMPKAFPLFKNILKFVQKEKDLYEYLPSSGMIVLVPTRKRQMVGVRLVDIKGIVQNVKVEDIDGSVMLVNDVVKYNHSEAGACSSLMMTSGQRPIRSMHIAGSDTNDGYGVLLTQEMIEAVIGNTIKLQYEELVLDSLADREDAAVFSTDTNVDYIGALDKGKVPFCPKKSKIERSLIEGQPKTLPAFLTGNSEEYKALNYEQSPLWYGCQKHGKVTQDLNTSHIKICKEALEDVINGVVKPLRINPKRLTVEQAIVGFDGLPYYDPIKLDTSAGYPWQLGEDTTKASLINVERNEKGEVIQVVCNEELLDEIRRKEKLRQDGIVPATIFVDTLKDERKLPAKRNKKGGTRVFCASPTDYTIAMRQNLLDYSAAFMQARFDAGHAVGINAKGKEWTELYRRLTAISPHNIIMLDYSNFGPAFNSGVAHAAAEIMIGWVLRNVEGVNQTELWALMYECLHSVHAMSATVYRQFAGSPSGAAITTLINTHVNELYIYLAWYALCKQKAQQISPDIFAVMRKHVCMVAYGDDLIMSVSNEFKDEFNTLTIQKYLGQFGITATSAEKENQDVKPFVNIMQAMFLKRKFRNHDTRPGYMLAPLDIVSVEEIPLWVWKSANKKAATKINVESALLEAHGHGKKYFQEFKDKLNAKLKEKNIEVSTLNWEMLDELWFEDKMPAYIDVL